MNRIASILAAVFGSVVFCFSSVWAMGGDGRACERPKELPLLSEKYADTLARELKLSGKQKAGVAAILQAERAGLAKKSAQLRELEEQMQAAHKELAEKTRDVHERIRAELNSEQKERFDEMRMRRGPHGRGRMRERPGPMEEGGPGGGNRGMDGWGPERDLPPPEMWHEGKGGEKSSGAPMRPRPNKEEKDDDDD